MRYVQRKLRVVLHVFWPCPPKTTPRRSLRAYVRWHQNKATQYVIKLLSAIFDNTNPVIKSFSEITDVYFVSVPDILYGRLRDFYIILNCVRTQKLNYAAMQDGRAPMEQRLLPWSYRPGYLWKSERIRNLSIFKEPQPPRFVERWLYTKS